MRIPLPKILENALEHAPAFKFAGRIKGLTLVPSSLGKKRTKPPCATSKPT